MDIGKGGYWVGKEHDTEARVRGVEAALSEVMNLHVSMDEVHIRDAKPGGSGARMGQHLIGDVDAENLAVGGDARGQFERRLTCSASEIDDSLARVLVEAIPGLPARRR